MMKARMCDKEPDSRFDVSDLLTDKGAVCVVDRALSMLDQARRESCGECVFCREGTLQLYMLLEDGITGKSQPEDLELLAELSASVRDNAGCDMAVAAARSLVELMVAYPDEFEQHFKRKRCQALKCKAYYTVHVMPDSCTGCGACAPLCPEGAISGDFGSIHVIDQDTCTRCGLCIETCAPISEAIVKAGPIKPRTPEYPVPVGSWGDGTGGRRRRRRGSENEDGGMEQ